MCYAPNTFVIILERLFNLSSKRQLKAKVDSIFELEFVPSIFFQMSSKSLCGLMRS